MALSLFHDLPLGYNQAILFNSDKASVYFSCIGYNQSNSDSCKWKDRLQSSSDKNRLILVCVSVVCVFSILFLTFPDRH